MEGNPAEFVCSGKGNLQPELSWIRVQGPINPEATFVNGIWRLPYVRMSDQAEYRCIARYTGVRGDVRTYEERTYLYVTRTYCYIKIQIQS